MAAKKLIRFENCQILRDGKIVNDDYLVIRGNKIVDYMSIFFDERLEPDVRIDCKGALLSPGLIDIQINGGFGYDFTHNVDNVEEGLNIVSEGILKHGVTGFCPTIVSSMSEVYRKLLPRINETSGAQNLGIHVEGPFINQTKVGAHVLENLRTLSGGLTTVEAMYGDLSKIKIITLAPELEGALDTIKELHRRDIIVSIGHSSTTLRTAETAVNNGASLITHLFNAMSSFHHRSPGLLGLLTSEFKNKKSIYFGLISDGCHTDPEAVRIAYRTNYESLVLVTDAISALGLQDGIHRIGEQEIEIKNDCAYISKTRTLCGSLAPLNRCVRLFNEYTNCGKVKALEAATLHPAQVLGIANQKGTLNPGSDADFVFFNDSFEVQSTWIDGCCRYSRYDDSFRIIE